MRWAGGSSCAAASGSDTRLKVDRLAAASQGAAAFFLPVRRTNTTADTLLAHLPDSPDVLPQKLDLIRESILLIQFGEDAYRSSSFLDDRILGPATRGAWFPVERVASRSPPRHRLATAVLHLSYGARRLDAGEPPARRDRAGPLAARAAAVADALGGPATCCTRRSRSSHRSSSKGCSIRCCDSGVGATPPHAPWSSRRRAALRAWHPCSSSAPRHRARST